MSKFTTYHHIKLEELRDYKNLPSMWQFEDRLKDYMFGTDTPDHLCFRLKNLQSVAMAANHFFLTVIMPRRLEI